MVGLPAVKCVLHIFVCMLDYEMHARVSSEVPSGGILSLPS